MNYGTTCKEKTYLYVFCARTHLVLIIFEFGSMRYLGAYTNYLYVGHAWIYFHRTRLQYIQESFSIELIELLFTLF